MWSTRILAFLFPVLSADGLIFIDGSSPAPNTETAPGGSLAGSGWDFQVNYLNYHATVISPKHVITARHLGASQKVLTRPVIFGATEEETYAIKGERILIGDTDFSIFEVWETFATWAELYHGDDEAGRELVIHGSGVDRGSEIPGVGWRWGTGESRKSRWGRNVIKGALTSNGKDFLYFSFDDLPGQDEVMATGGDSGGGWFIQEEGVWKLAAVSSAVDAFYSQGPLPTNANGFRGAVYDGSGLFYGSDAEGWKLIPTTGESGDPEEIEFYRQSHTYGSRISSRLEEIKAVIAPALAWAELDPPGRFTRWLADHGVTVETGVADDPDRDGVANLEEYLAESDPSDPGVAQTGLSFEIPESGVHRLTLRETLDLAGRGLRVEIESSPDLLVWRVVEDLSEHSQGRQNADGFRWRVLERDDPGGGTLFYRLRISLSS